MRALLTALSLAVAALPVQPASAELSAAVAEACRDALPAEMAEAAEPGARSGSGPAGRWSLEAGAMDGVGTDEAILVILPAGRPGKVYFFADREGKDPERKQVKLKGPPVTYASVAFHAYTEDAAVAHVDAGESGQVILHWNGKKLGEVWKIGQIRDDERHWFNVEDLDGDGVREIVRFFRRDLDVYTDEDDLADEGGSVRQEAGQVDAVAVYRWADGKWKKDKALLESLK